MSSNFNYHNDILPLGDFEAVPVSSLIPPYPEHFPNVVNLNKPTNVDKLKEDFNNFKKTGNYFKDRAKYFKNNFKDTVQLFDDLGFSFSNYKAYPIRELGTNILKSDLGEYTSALLNNFGVPLFRQQYVVASKGWSTKFHIDHPDFTLHGFRVFIPIDHAYIGFKEGIYKLNAGECYFVNIAKLHRGFSADTRVVIMCQMASDKLIRGKSATLPVDISTIPEEFRNAPE